MIVRTKKQQIMRVDKTAQDRMPIAERPRVQAHAARLKAQQAHAAAERSAG